MSDEKDWMSDPKTMRVCTIIACVLFTLVTIMKSVDLHHSIKETAFVSSSKIVFYNIFSQFKFILLILIYMIIIFAAIWILILFLAFLLTALQGEKLKVGNISKFVVTMVLGYIQAFNFKSLPAHLICLSVVYALFVIFFVVLLYNPKKVAVDADDDKVYKIEHTMKEYMFFLMLMLTLVTIIFVTCNELNSPIPKN
jgi:hypothetical protein